MTKAFSKRERRRQTERNARPTTPFSRQGVGRGATSTATARVDENGKERVTTPSLSDAYVAPIDGYFGEQLSGAEANRRRVRILGLEEQIGLHRAAGDRQKVAQLQREIDGLKLTN